MVTLRPDNVSEPLVSAKITAAQPDGDGTVRELATDPGLVTRVMP